MKRKDFRTKLNLKKEVISNLNHKQMGDAVGGMAPATTNDTYYTKVIQNGHCTQPAPADGCVPHTKETACFFKDTMFDC